MFRISRIIYIWALVIIAITVLVFYLRLNHVRDCDLREQTNPTVPVYPSSLLIEDSRINEPQYGIIGYTYSVDTNMNNLVDFFDEYSTCGTENWANQVRCRGEADPFGIFDVHIPNDLSGQITIYEIEVAWDKCDGSGDPDISIENP